MMLPDLLFVEVVDGTLDARVVSIAQTAQGFAQPASQASAATRDEFGQ
jgi:hypothetical protein